MRQMPIAINPMVSAVSSSSDCPTNESALRNCIKALGERLISLHHQSDVWTVLVVVGVVLEVVVLIKEYRDELIDFRHGFVHAPQKPSFKLLLFGMFGVVLVAGGIMGELLTGVKIQNKEEQLARANEALVNLVELNVLSKATQLRIDLDNSIKEGKATATRLEGAQKKAVADATATGTRLEAAQEKALASEAKLQSDIQMDELRLAADQSGHILWYHLFGRLKGQRPAHVEVICARGSRRETRLFAEKLSDSLSGLGWPSGISEKIWDRSPTTADVTVFNKWADGEVNGFHDLWGEPEPSEARVLVSRFGMSTADATRLLMLTLAIGGTLKKDPDLPENSFRILVADPTKKQ
jgi:hypothetical protein